MKHIILFILASTLFLSAKAQEKQVSGFVDLNLYYDTRDLQVMTLNTLVNLPKGFQYYGFVNYFNAIDAEDDFELTTYYTEHHFRWKPKKEVPLSITLLYNSISGGNNDTLRLGFRYDVTETVGVRDFFKKISFSYSINFHALEFELESRPGHGFQIEHSYFWLILPEKLNKRVYLSGFADHNIRTDRPNGEDAHSWVTEHQLGVRTVDNLYLVAEYRYSEKMSQRSGVGFGLQYKVNF